MQDVLPPMPDRSNTAPFPSPTPPPHARHRRIGRRGAASPTAIGGILLGALLGIIVFGAIRSVAIPAPEEIHYHANWALWIDGERVDFSADRYMEDVAACAADPANLTAQARVHMHENNPDVVHVHHAGATWGHLLQNLGWGVGPDWLVTDRGEMHRAEDGKRLTWILNGMVVPAQHDRVIRPGDRLLISFGEEDTDELLGKQFQTVAANAHEYDGEYESAGCAGEPEGLTLGDRLRQAFWF